MEEPGEAVDCGKKKGNGKGGGGDFEIQAGAQKMKTNKGGTDRGTEKGWGKKLETNIPRQTDVVTREGIAQAEKKKNRRQKPYALPSFIERKRTPAKRGGGGAKLSKGHSGAASRKDLRKEEGRIEAQHNERGKTRGKLSNKKQLDGPTLGGK